MLLADSAIKGGVALSKRAFASAKGSAQRDTQHKSNGNAVEHSEVPAAAVRAFHTYVENQVKGLEVRTHREELVHLREEEKAERLRRGQEQSTKGRQQMRHLRHLQDERHRHNQELGRRLKADKEAARRMLEAARFELFKQVRERAEAAHAAQMRMDSTEAEAAAKSRLAASLSSAGIHDSVLQSRGQGMAARHERAAFARENNRQRVTNSCEKVAHDHLLSAQIAREQTDEGKRARLQKVDEYVEAARANKAAAATLRSKIREKSLDLQQRKKRQADEVRRRKIEAKEEQRLATSGELAAKQKAASEEHAKLYGRFDEAHEYSASPLQALHSWSHWAMQTMDGIFGPPPLDDERYTSHEASFNLQALRTR